MSAWAYRERPRTPGGPVHRVELLQKGPPRSNKVRIRWLDGEYEGLDEWVSQFRLIVPWEEAEDFLADEERLEAVRKAGENIDPLLDSAIGQVFIAQPEDTYTYVDLDSALFITDFFEREEWLGFTTSELLDEPLAFVDRHGTYHAPLSVAEKVARRICELYPQQVTEHIGQEEARLQEEALRGRSFTMGRGRTREEWFVPPKRCAEYLREREPVFAVVREWCGEEAERWNELQALREEVDRLRKVISDLAFKLRLEGSYGRASWLRRQLTVEAEEDPTLRRPRRRSGPPNRRGADSVRLRSRPFLG